MAEQQLEPHVEELPDGRLVVEGAGLTALQAAMALQFFRSEWGELVGETSQEMRRHLMARLLKSGVTDIVEPASLAQARRQAALKASLLGTPVYTYETLSEVRNDPSVSATRTAVSRARQEGRVFTVPHEGRTLLPAFQFDSAGSPRADLAPLLGPLLDAQLGAWQLWTWLTRPAALLSGLVPEQAAANTETAERAARAAQRLAARVPSATQVETAARNAVADVVAERGNQMSLKNVKPGEAFPLSIGSITAHLPDDGSSWAIIVGESDQDSFTSRDPDGDHDGDLDEERAAEPGADRRRD